MTSLTRPVTRFAPSPTGHLHLGHVVNAIHVWGIARSLAGRVLLRIEDHDRQRSRPAFERSILEDLEWLGLEADSPLARQSERDSIYRRHLDRLRDAGLAYACACSRKDVTQLSPVRPGEEPRYPGTCRELKLDWEEGRAIRVRLPGAAVEFDDLRLGAQRQVPAEQCGDLQARDRLGNWTYQFAVTVDDWEQEIGLVIRGEDLLPSTGRQVLLGELLGRKLPARFYHHGLLLRPDGGKLSKSAGDTGIRELRAAGESRESVLGRAANLAGLGPAGRRIAPGDLASLFSGGDFDLVG